MKKLIGLLIALGTVAMFWRWRRTEPSRKERVLGKSKELAASGSEVARSASASLKERLRTRLEEDRPE